MRKLATFSLIAVFSIATSSLAEEPSWVEKSNEHAQVVLDVLAKLSPEGAGGLGIDGLDEEISDLGPGIWERSKQMSREVVEELKRRLGEETDSKVRQDLGILIKMLEDSIRSSDLNYEQMLPYYNVNQTVYYGVRSILDPQNSRDRYPAAIARLEKYAGIADGHRPYAELAKDRTAERFDVEGLVGPFRGQVEQDLERADTMITGIEELLAGTDLQGWEESYATLAAQMRDYNEWVRAEILPRARADYRLPVDLYEDALRNWGVDASPLDLIEQATKGYMDIRGEMQALAPLIAAEKGYDTTDYREVIRLLKRDGPLDGDKILDHYNAVLRDIEEIIVREKLVTLPDRDAGIEVASAAESAAQPAPHLRPPRLIGNTGEYPVFVLPQLIQNEDGSWQQTDDTYEAGAWTLTAHEARPGHEMQFSSIVESGVSITRAVFAFNSVNVEGWGLYAEAIVRPYLPLEGQLISLQYRLMRAARMFLDPMLNLGLITPDEAKNLIMNDMAIGESWAQNEIERYTYRMPGQATAYYYGYGKMQSLRTQTELKLRDDFDQQAFHDFVLSQGMLPPHLLKDAVMNEFVPSQKN
ncbi:MAG: DUF885 family protein [Gammaproteobacteria bacterium]|jgi:uncharacterized protein (DUF885 family)|nr:DUF885 family protein [Gammaproteobacteria bacterium]